MTRRRRAVPAEVYDALVEACEISCQRCEDDARELRELRRMHGVPNPGRESLCEQAGTKCFVRRWREILAAYARGER